MKTIFLLSLLSLFISIAFSDRLSANLNQQFLPPPAVFTTEGHVLVVGAPYRILTNAFEPVGLCLTDVHNSSAAQGVCPHDVVQCSHNMRDLSVTFTPLFPSVDPFIRENTPYHLRFVIAGPCAQESAIAIAPSQNFHRWFVFTETVTILSQFQIQRVGLGYHIAFCIFSPIPYAQTPCFDTGFRVENGNSRLGAGEGIKGAEFFFRAYRNAVSNDDDAAAAAASS